jgi:hypothetical protein
MALINNSIGDTLPDQMRADGKTFQTMFVQNIVAALDVTILRQRPIHLKMIPPAGQFEAIITPTGRFLGEYIQG